MAEVSSGLYNAETGMYKTRFNTTTDQAEKLGISSASENSISVVARTEDNKVPANLDYVIAKANELVKIEDEIEDLEKQLEAKKLQYRKVRIEELPQAMFELEINSVGVGNVVVEIEPLITASLPKEPEARKKALDYLVDLRQGGHIKRSLELDLPKGNEIMEHRVIDALKAVDPSLNPRIDATVHHSTYTALCKRLVESDRVIDREKLGIYSINIARVVR